MLEYSYLAIRILILLLTTYDFFFTTLSGSGAGFIIIFSPENEWVPGVRLSFTLRQI